MINCLAWVKLSEKAEIMANIIKEFWSCQSPINATMDSKTWKLYVTSHFLTHSDTDTESKVNQILKMSWKEFNDEIGQIGSITTYCQKRFRTCFGNCPTCHTSYLEMKDLDEVKVQTFGQLQRAGYPSRYYIQGMFKLCRICYKQAHGDLYAFLPCGHAACKNCSDRIKMDRETCPFCRTHIDTIIKILN